MNWGSETLYLVKDVYYCHHILSGSNEVCCCLTVKQETLEGGLTGEKKGLGGRWWPQIRTTTKEYKNCLGEGFAVYLPEMNKRSFLNL